MFLDQKQAEYLIKVKKQFKETNALILNECWTKDLISDELKEIFLLDYYRGKIELTKYTYNKRYRKSIVLLRYDAQGTHTNPDGKKFKGPHIHIYKEGYGDKFAHPTDELGVKNGDNKEEILKKFLQHCNVDPLPSIQLTI